MADLDAIRAGLRDQIEALSEHLLGPRNRALSNPRHWRWGGSGGLSICVNGPHRGACIDFRDGWKGDPLGLVMRERRCDFKAVLAWAGSWLGIDASYAPDPEAERQRRQEREQRQREQAAEDARDNARRIRKAQELWAKRVTDPIDTLGERYITVTRRIPIKPSEWPDSVGVLPRGIRRWMTEDGVWHEAPYAAAIIVAATDDAGTIQAVQRVFLDDNAAPMVLTSGKKISNGQLGGCAVRLPGPPDKPLLLAEGPETGLSCWAATGFETWIALGALSCITLPVAERSILACRDDDPAQSPADKAFNRAVADWQALGIHIDVATPWAERRGDKSDFNDVLLSGGAAAVHSLIKAALPVAPDDPRLTAMADALVRAMALDPPPDALTAAAYQFNAEQPDPLPTKHIDDLIRHARERADVEQERAHAA